LDGGLLKDKVKAALGLTSAHVTKMCGEVEVRIHVFLALTLCESDMIRTQIATLREMVPDTTGCEEVWIGQPFGMVAKRKIPALAGV